MAQGRGGPRRSERERDIFLSLLRELREEAGLTQRELAERLDRNQTYVSKYELGERRLDFLDLREVVKALNISLPSFVRRYDARLPHSR